MTSRELLARVCALRPEWRDQAEAIVADELFYPAIAELGRSVFAAQLEGSDAAWIDSFYATIERGLEEGDDETKNLIVVGLFESLQGQSYHRGDPDLIERRLGTASLRAWRALLQGWTGGDVCTVAAWRRVIRNGVVTSVRWERRGAIRSVDWSGAEPRAEYDGRTIPIDLASADRLQRALAPWLAEAVVASRPIPAEWDETITIEGGRERVTVHAMDRWLFDGKRWFEASIAALPWPMGTRPV